MTWLRSGTRNNSLTKRIEAYDAEGEEYFYEKWKMYLRNEFEISIM